MMRGPPLDAATLDGVPVSSTTNPNTVVRAQQSSTRPASGSNGNGSIVRKCDIGPNDVLCGRGIGVQSNPGNIAFRGVISTRVAEYVAAKTHREKQRVAREIMDHILNGVDPPVRFLALVGEHVDLPEDFPEKGDRDELWSPIDEQAALEKVKQTLRNESRKDRLGTHQPEELGHGSQEMSRKDRLVTHQPEELENWSQEMSQKAKTCIANGVSNDAIFDGLDAQMGTMIDPSDSELLGIIAQDVAKSTAPTAAEPVYQGEEKNSSPEGRDVILQTVRVAFQLASRVRECHNAHVSYRGNSVGNSPTLADDLVRSDLVSLGSDVYKHFSGVDPFECSSSGIEDFTSMIVSGDNRILKRGRAAHQRSYVPLRDLGFPVSLCILVSSLLDAEDNDMADRYSNAEEVEDDLRLMMIDPDRYLFDVKADRQCGKLLFPEGRLYGRDNHTIPLMAAFDRVVGTGGSREMVLISGYSGTGKSVLVDQLRQPLLAKNGHFISCKFDELGQLQPMSVIFAGFDEFCKAVLSGDKYRLAKIRLALQSALSSHCSVLADLIPNLSQIVGVSDRSPSPSVIDGTKALNRFLFYFRSFVRAIASPSYPVILFLDDLQWADKAALDLVATLVADSENSSLLFVGSFRDNEVGNDHPLNAAVQNIGSAGVNITNVKLENIDRESVNAMISDTLQLSPRLTRSLGKVIYTKTSGNPLFAVQFLRSLYDDTLLQFSARSRRWEWDIDDIQSKDIADNVVDLMMHKMLRLDPGVQMLLKESACLGSRIELSTVKLLGNTGDYNGSGIKAILDVAVDEGLMCRIGSSYKFSHDRIKEAAYCLIPASEREALHLHIGKLLWRRASAEELNSLVFIIVDQLSRGCDLICDHAEKVEVAGLCLMAGKKSMSSSAFLQASIYLLQGTMMLDESDWEEHYDLTLELFSTCAEAQYVTGNYDGVLITSNPIFAQSRSFEDKLGAYFTLLNSLGSQGKQLDAINMGLQVAAQLGQSFPNEISQNDVMNDFSKTQAMLKGKTTGDILHMKEMQNATMVFVMKLLNLLVRYAYQVNQQLLSLLNCRMVQLSLCHGVSRESSVVFSVFGFVLCSFGKVKEGYQYGKLALSLLERFNAKEYLARVYCVVYYLVNPAVEPLQACLASQKHGYEVGMSTGDILWSFTLCFAYMQWALQTGCKLEALAEEIRTYMHEMKERKHQALVVCLPNYQAILNLMGCSEDPTELTGDAMNQEETLNMALEKGHSNIANRIYFIRMWLAYIFGRYDLAAEMAKRCLEMSNARPFRPEMVVNETFYSGLTAVLMAHKGEGGGWNIMAFEAVAKMETWAANSPWNYEHKLHLLKAEIAYYLNGDVSAAMKAYDDSILSAGEHGFVDEQALACERAGVFYSKAVSPETGTGYLKRSHEYYLQWGATRKADDVLKIIDRRQNVP